MYRRRSLCRIGSRFIDCQHTGSCRVRRRKATGGRSNPQSWDPGHGTARCASHFHRRCERDTISGDVEFPAHRQCRDASHHRTDLPGSWLRATIDLLAGRTVGSLTMSTDSINDEILEIKRALAAKFDNDLARIVADAQSRERNTIALPPRRRKPEQPDAPEAATTPSQAGRSPARPC